MVEKCTIVTDSGVKVEGIAPVIISASRSTDIPAFYAKWFFNRLARGYCIWYNPFNQKPTYVSFSRCKVVVFWTKNPEPIIPYLPELDRLGIHYYFQVTLNDYEREGFEPSVPPLEQRIETFLRLSKQIGADRVIWRYDPLIATNTLTPQEHLKRIWRIGNRLKGHTQKLIFSFVDVKDYRCVQSNLVRETKFFTKENVLSAEPNEEQCREIAKGLVELRTNWESEGFPLTLATCCEKGDFEGVEHNCCIDGGLMERLFESDRELMYYLRTGKLPEPDLFGSVPSLPEVRKNMKDKGQRASCGCMISKDIGMYSTCRHYCVYCYANRARNCVANNVINHDDNAESIVGVKEFEK